MVAVDQPVNGLSATAQINITVLDVNDNNPQYSEFQNFITIPEDKTGKVTQIQVSDRDIGLNGEVNFTTYSYNDVFGFKMVRGLTHSKAYFLRRHVLVNAKYNLRFYVNFAHYSVFQDGTLMLTGPLDREKQEIYDLVLVARDYGTPPRYVNSFLWFLTE